MSDCRETKGLLGCFKPDDGSEPETLAVHYVYDANGAIFATYYYDAEDKVIDKDIYRGGGSVTLGECELDTRYEIFVVRLAGDATGTATARIEGVGFSGADVGNTYTIGAGSAFTDYVSYSAIWLGDTVQDAPLDWNGLSYRAGLGSGSAGYQHASLPSLGEVLGETHTDTIALTANAGAFIEFRFKVKV